MSRSDFLSGLVQIRNGETSKEASARGLEVVRQNKTVLDDAISSRKHKTTLPRVSDKTESYYKPSQLSRISQYERPQTKTKYIVLDNRAIDEIAEMSNSQRRSFLAHLSDGERRKVLRALRVRDDLETGQVERRDLNRKLEPQDLYVINDLLTKFAYSRKDDELRMLESYKDILDDGDAQEAAVMDIINKVIDNTLDLTADEETLNIVYDFLEDNKFETESLQTALTVGFGDTLDDNDGVVGEENDNNLELGDELGDESGDDLDLEGGDDLDLEGDETDEPDLSLGDSRRPEPRHLKRVSDNRVNFPRPERRIERKRVEDTARESFDDVEALIIDDAYDLADSMLNGRVMNISDSMNEIVERYTKRCGERVRVKDCMDRAFTHSITELSSAMHAKTQKVKDDIIDQIDDRLGDGGDGEDTNKTLLESLGKALEAFANGDTSELEALSELSVDDINPDEETLDDNMDLDGDETGDDLDLEGGETDGNIFDETGDDEDKEDDEDDEDEEDGVDKIKLKTHDSAYNAVMLAKLLVANDKNANRFIDSLKNDVPILKKYNFKISDSEIIEPDERETVEVIEPVLNCEEFHSVYQAPVYVGEMAKESNPVECLSAAAVNYGDLSPVIQVECENGTVQNWIPIMGSSEKIAEQLNAEDADVEKIISDNCVPADDYYSVAAKTNNLGIIDCKFYKRKMSDECWVCDDVPEFIKDDGVECGATFAQEGLTTMPMEIPTGSVLIYGTKYNYYNKNKKR